MNWDYYSCHSFQNQGNLNQKEVHNYFNSKLNASHYLAPSFHEYLIVGEILFPWITYLTTRLIPLVVSVTCYCLFELCSGNSQSIFNVIAVSVEFYSFKVVF